MPASYFILLIVEAIIFFSAIYMAAVIRFLNFDLTAYELGALWPRAIIILVVLISTMTAMGLYDRHSRHSFGYIILRTMLAFILGFMGISLFFYMSLDLFIGRGVLLISLGLSYILVIIARLMFIEYLEKYKINHRVLILGTGRKAALIENLLRRKADRRGIDIIGYFYIAGEESVIKKEKVINYKKSIKEYVQRENIDEIVIAIDDRRKSFPLHDVVDCRLDGIIVVDFISFIEKRACKVLVADLDPSWLMYSDGFNFGVFNYVTKRIFDVSVSSILLIAFSPILLMAILAMYIEDRWHGGVFYDQKRVGLNGHIFTIFKLRSMRPSAESGGKERWASTNDDRVTWVGKILRKYRIDEVPQLINVIAGDMSFVGPRPERPEFVQNLTSEIPYFEERHRVKPGITGWAQICYPYGASVKDSRAKLEYDLYYVKNCNLFLDFVILFQTAQVVLFGKGAR